jgi:hypothetical protein
VVGEVGLAQRHIDLGARPVQPHRPLQRLDRQRRLAGAAEGAPETEARGARLAQGQRQYLAGNFLGAVRDYQAALAW